MYYLYPVAIIISAQLVVLGVISVLALVWIGRQKDTLNARVKILRLLFWLMVAVAVIASTGQLYLHVTGKSPGWFPHPTVFVMLPVVGLLYRSTMQAMKDRRPS